MEEKSPTKRIELVELPITELKKSFGNPRKISAKKMKELQESIERHGDFGVIVINDKNEIISGHQRVTAMEAIDPYMNVQCKRLVGYSESELRAINIKANTHAGEWDLNLLAQWTADLNIDLGLSLNNKSENDIKIKDMELIRYEKYNYVLIVCRSEPDFMNLSDSLGISGKKVILAPNKKVARKMKARAIWYDDIQCTLKKKD